MWILYKDGTLNKKNYKETSEGAVYQNCARYLQNEEIHFTAVYAVS